MLNLYDTGEWKNSNCNIQENARNKECVKLEATCTAGRNANVAALEHSLFSAIWTEDHAT